MNRTKVRENSFREALFSGGMDLPGMDALLSLYRELYPLRRTAPEADLGLTAAEVSMRQDRGLTLLKTEALLPGGLDLTVRARDIAGILAGHSEDPDTVTATADRFFQEPGVLSNLVGAYMTGGGSELKNKVLSPGRTDPEVVVFVVFNVLKAVFLSAGRQFAQMVTDQWNRGRCPVCGARPAVSYMAGEGGKRYLVCHRCETAWRFRRLACPFCEHESPESTTFMYIEEPEYRLMAGYVCDRCGHYIKTWRMEGAPGSLHPEVEDLKTPGFDISMEAEGFRRGAPNIFGVLVGDLRTDGNESG